MPFSGAWCKVWIYFGFVFAWTKGARPRFDTSTDMGLVLIPADAEIDSVIFRLRATDQDADFPLVFEITGNPYLTVVRIDNLPCTLYNKVCQANVILTKRLVPGRLHDFAVRVRDTKGDSNSMQATISVTNATTPRDKIFPHIPSLIMVPEDTKPGKELDYLLVRANSWSGKPVYIELWQPKELFTIRQRQTPTQTRGVITLIGELDFETQSVYTLTMYATDPYTEPGKDTRNIAGLNVVVIVTDVQDVPPIFTLAPPLTRINNSVQPGDIVLRVHAEDGDKGVPREVVYGLVSEGNPFTPFFNISETSGEIILARPLEELTQITHVGAPVVLTVVAEELRRSRDEPPAQATVVDVGFLLGEPGNTPPYFESDNYVATIDENLEPGTVINFGEQYTTRVKDEDIGKAGVFALKLENNNGTFEINPTVAERTADFIVIVRDNTLIDYELYKTLSFKIVAQEVGPATNLSTSVPVTIFLKDVNDNPPVFDQKIYEVTLSENVTVGSRVIQVHATDIDTGIYGDIRYTGVTGEGSKAFNINPDTGLVTVAMGSSLDREIAAKLELSVEARDYNGTGNIGVTPLIVNLLDVNDNPPIFEKDVYEFMLNSDLTNFTSPAFLKAIDNDAEPPNNIVRYEIIHGNYENKFYLNETSGELILRPPITKIRRKKQNTYDTFGKKTGEGFVNNQGRPPEDILKGYNDMIENESTMNARNKTISTLMDKAVVMKLISGRRKRDQDNALYTLTARAYDLGIPHLSSVTEIRIISGTAMEARIMMFVVPGEQPNSTKTAETLATITGGRVTVLETRPYIQPNLTGSTSLPGGGKKTIVIARVEQTEPGTPLVDVEKIIETVAAYGVRIINGTDNVTTIHDTITPINESPNVNNVQETTIINNTVTNVHNEEVTVYKAENKLLFWLLIILGLLMLLAIAILIICCICPGCPFYMAPRKRRVHSSETLIVRPDGRPKRHLHRQPPAMAEVSWNGRKQAWSADPTRRNWQFNKRNVKNCSLPGDVAYISGPPNDIQMNHEAHRLRDASSYDHLRKIRMDEQDRMYIEEMEGQKQRGYDMPEIDSLQRHEMERESDTQRQGYRQRYTETAMNGEAIREQHFYREGNAEVLRLVTRGQVEDTSASHVHRHHHVPTTLIVDGKDIILQRFIEDQKSRPEMTMQDIEAARMMESHQRPKDIYQPPQPPEIILIPDRLEMGHRQHIEEIGPNVQRLVIDHGDYESQKTDKGSQIGESLRKDKEGLSSEVLGPEMPSMLTKEQMQQSKSQYSFSDLELARQKALLARLLLKGDNRHLDGGIIDSASYLETQSLPGQVAIATQTDRTTATQTDRHVRSRSDNDESDEDSRHRKKLKSRKKYGDGDWKRAQTLWMKSPIDEKSSPCFDKRLSILQRKVKEVKEDRKISLEPDVLREISDSLNGNGSSYKGEEDKSLQAYRKSTEQSSVSYKVLNETENDSSSSIEPRKKKRERAFGEKSCEDLSDDQKLNGTESTSSPDMKLKHDKSERIAAKSPKKESKSHSQKKDSTKPSFRILEKEFTMLTKKFSKLGEKKFQETGSDSTSQEKSETKRDQGQKGSKKAEASSSQKGEMASNVSKTEQKAKQKKETAIAKTKQKLRYQQSNVMSTGSSEYDDLFEKNKKQGKTRQESVKQKQTLAGHAKVKRQPNVGRQEVKKQMAEAHEEDIEKRKEVSVKETIKTESKEKTGKTVTRAPKLNILHRKDRVVEESSYSTASDQMDSRKEKVNLSSIDKKSTTDSSGTDSKVKTNEKRSIVEKVLQRFSDDFVEQKVESVKLQTSEKEDKKEKTVKDIGRKGIVHEKRVSPEKKLVKNGSVAAKPLAEKWITAEEEVTTKVMKDSEALQDAVYELIKTSVGPDIQGKKAKLKESTVAGDLKFEKGMMPFHAESVVTEKPREYEEEHEKLADIASTVKVSKKNGVQDDERESKIGESEKSIIPVVMDVLLVNASKEKLLEELDHKHVEEKEKKEPKEVKIKDEVMGKHKQEQKKDEMVEKHKEEQKKDEMIEKYKEKQEKDEVTEKFKQERRKDGGIEECKDVQKKDEVIEKHKDEQKKDEVIEKHKDEQKKDDVIEKHKDEQKKDDVIEKHKDEQKKDDVIEKHKDEQKKDEKEKKRISPEKKEMQVLDSDDRLILETKQSTEDKPEIEELKIDKSSEIPGSSKIDLTKDIKETTAAFPKDKSSDDEKKSLKKDFIHKAEDIMKESELLGFPEHIKEEIKYPKIEINDNSKKIEKIDLAEDPIKNHKREDKTLLDEAKPTETERQDDKTDDQIKSDFPEKETIVDEVKGSIAEVTSGIHLIGIEATAPNTEDVLEQRKESSEGIESYDTKISDTEGKSTTIEQTVEEKAESTAETKVKDEVIKEESIVPHKEEEIISSPISQSKEEGSAFLDKEAASDKKEEAASEKIEIDDLKISEQEKIISDEDKEQYLKAKKAEDTKESEEYEQIGEDKDIFKSKAEASPMKDQAIIEKVQVNDEISQKDGNVGDISAIKEDEFTSEDKIDRPKTEDTTLRISCVREESKEEERQKEDFLEPLVIEEHGVKKDEVLIEELPSPEITSEDSVKKEVPPEKLEDKLSESESVFLQVPAVVHLFDNNLASKVESPTDSIGKESKITESPVHFDKDTMEKKNLTTDVQIVDHREVPSIDKPFHSEVLKLLKQAEDERITKAIEEKIETDKPPAPEDKETKSIPTESIEIKTTEKHEESKSTDERLEESSIDKIASTIETEETEDRGNVSEQQIGLVSETLEETAELEEPHNVRGDRKLAETNAKKDERDGFPSGGSHGIELFQTSTATSEGTTEGKLALDFITPETPIDSTKISEPEKQSQSEYEQIESPRAGRSEESSSALAEESMEPFPGDENGKREAPTVSEDGVGEQRSADETRTLDEKDTTGEGRTDVIAGEECTDVSLPLFTEIMQTADDLDDSDSSSDISRKTTLTTRPYQTPRHRSRQSPERENIQMSGSAEAQNFEDDDMLLTIELVKGDDLKSPSEAAKDEDTGTDLKAQTSIRLEETMDMGNEYARKEERTMSTSEFDEESSTTLRNMKDIKEESSMKELDETYVEPLALPKGTKSNASKPTEKKGKVSEKRRLPPQRKKKSSSEESSEEKALHLHEQAVQARYKPRRKFESDQAKQKYDRSKPRKTDEEQQAKPRIDKKTDKHPTLSKGSEIDTSKTQPKYMAWYKKNREEMERRRAELKASDDESQLPRWLRRSMRSQKADKEEKKKLEKSEHPAATSRAKRKVKPLVNVESEQLKAIVRQGRKLRKAEGGRNQDPPVQIFAAAPPAATDAKHHLVQHSEYKYEKLPTPFYLHPPPAPHPSPQLSPEHFEVQVPVQHSEEFDSAIAIPLQGGARLRHQQLLEKKSVFDIAYSEAAPSQLRADSTTPPS
nr:uncharacterized protein LOC116427790 [Nomia melanderi]